MFPLHRLQLYLENSIPWVVLGVLLLYTYGEIGYAPYLGFSYAPSSGVITEVFVSPPFEQKLEPGDQLQQVGSVTWPMYLANLRQPLFAHVKNGQSLAILIKRNGKIQTIRWRIPEPTFWDVISRLFNVWWLAYLFWLAGAATVLLVRPKDERWRLFVAAYFLTALWLVAGNTSRWRIWESAIVLRVAIWLSVPVYLHLHWLFPQPLRRLSPGVWGSAYLISLVLATLQWWQALPNNMYLLGFLLALGGSLALLIVHFIYQPQERIRIRLLIAAITLAFIPAIGLSIAQAGQALPSYGPAALLALPFIPGVYFYLTYRHRLGGLELRANRLIVLYIFLVLLSTASMLLIALVNLLVEFPEQIILVGSIIALMSAVITVFGFAPFQRWIEAYLLGLQTTPVHLVEVYATRITTSLDMVSLIHILHDEVLPGFLIRQSVLLQFQAEKQSSALYMKGVSEHQLPNTTERKALLAETGKYRPLPLDDSSSQLCPWVRLVLVLKERDQVLGLWLLGKRDPDDFYAHAEIATLQALANQTAIALANIHQTEQLRMLYRANIDRHELERTHLAHTLHDEVLNQLAVLSMYVEEFRASPQFDAAYETLISSIRQLITGLRPAMTHYGLHAAFEELVEALNERAKSVIVIDIELPESPIRYDIRVEQAIFRIVQQACENALRHAQAQSIRVHGKLEPEQIRLSVADNGVGFAIEQPIDFSTLLTNQHFGLVGMYERAALIGATLWIDSFPGHGTHVALRWHSAVAAPSPFNNA
ncbi:MAG: ATP-binding protein [Caldilineaceae bacterium]